MERRASSLTSLLMLSKKLSVLSIFVVWLVRGPSSSEDEEGEKWLLPRFAFFVGANLILTSRYGRPCCFYSIESK